MPTTTSYIFFSIALKGYIRLKIELFPTPRHCGNQQYLINLTLKTLKPQARITQEPHER